MNTKKITIEQILYSLLLISLSGCFDSGNNSPDSNTGIAGSTAKFAIQNNHLLSVEDRIIKVFSLEKANQPTLTNTYSRRERLETIYPYEGNKVMLGTNNGVIIMDHSIPGELNEISFISHVTSCDPVVANSNYIFITLRNGNNCGASGLNELQIINIEDINNPILIKTVSLDQPWGLGIHSNTLYVCIRSGLVAFDISEPEKTKEIARYSVQCNDIITSDPMILTSDNNIKIITIDDETLLELSTISKEF